MNMTAHSWTYLPLSSALLAATYNDLFLLFMNAVLLAYLRRLQHLPGTLSEKSFKRTHLYLSMTGTTPCIAIMSTVKIHFLIIEMTQLYEGWGMRIVAYEYNSPTPYKQCLIRETRLSGWVCYQSVPNM